MKKKIHPMYYKEASQECACGAVFNIPSTQKETKTEICSKCHPFYTGKTKMIDSAGQLDKFKKRMIMTKNIKKKTKTSKKSK